MEDKNEKATSTKSSSWIECVSKTRPGKKYLFNTATGERMWLKSLTSFSEKPTKPISSPANDRLKRLQKELQKPKPVAKKFEEKRKTASPVKQKQPTSSKPIIPTAALPIALSKDAPKILREKAMKDQRNNVQNEPHGSISSRSEKAVVLGVPKITPQPKERIQQRKLQKRPFETKELSAKKQRLQRSTVSPSREHLITKEIVIPRIISSSGNSKKDMKNISNHLLQHHEALTPVKMVQKTPELKFLTAKSDKKSSSPERLKCSANKRLQCFRKTLQHDYDRSKNISIPIENGVSKKNSDCEAMDWESTEDPNQSGIGPLIFRNNNTYEEPTDMEVDENLMLVAAEAKQETTLLQEKWHKSSIYLVLDTNVFISHLSFIEELKTRSTLDGSGIILYIPYSVLQELDKLKVREKIKEPVVRAIRYLNKMFEEKNAIFQAQSALEERKHIIEVHSGDDSILNCCLQVKEHIPNVILLSADVNLRNKAICNDIAVSTKSGLLQKISN